MSNTFTLICNNCGGKSIIRMEEIMWKEDEEGKYFTRDIIQEGEVCFEVSYNYEETRIYCSKCGIEIDNDDRAEYK